MISPLIQTNEDKARILLDLREEYKELAIEYRDIQGKLEQLKATANSVFKDLQSAASPNQPLVITLPGRFLVIEDDRCGEVVYLTEKPARKVEA